MKSSIKLSSSLLALFMLLAFAGSAIGRSPNLDAALDDLKAAKTATDPMPQLNAAIKSLNRATQQQRRQTRRMHRPPQPGH